MNRRKNIFRKFLFVIVVVLCLILSSVFINRNFNLPDFFIKDGILFVDRFLTHPFESYSDEDYNRLITENENLKKELDKIKYYEAENEELTNEVKKLKELVNINKSLSDKTYVNGSVISRGVDYWNDSLIIDKGSDDDIDNNMAVVSGGYLIGITSISIVENISEYSL